MGGALVIPPAALSRPAPGAPVPIAVFTTNPAVFQVATSINYAWPSASATLAPSSGPAAGGPTAFGTGLGGGNISYTGGGFGGPAQFAISAGPGAAGGRVPPNGGGALPVASVWINCAGGLPTTVGAVAVVGASAPAGVAQPGAPITAPTATTMFGPLSPGAGPFGALNVTGMTTGTMTGMCVAFCATPMGGIASSLSLPSVTVPTPMGGTAMLAGLSNMVTGSKGFPWTTGFITIAQPAAVPPETFWLSGTDNRVSGVGNISLVSGALSVRNLSGPNANRGWLSLNLAVPEPTTIAGATAALGLLAVGHTMARRRRG